MAKNESKLPQNTQQNSVFKDKSTCDLSFFALKKSFLQAKNLPKNTKSNQKKPQVFYAEIIKFFK